MMAYLFFAIPSLIIFLLFIRKNKAYWFLKLVGSCFLGVVAGYILFIIYALIIGYHG